MKKYLYVVLGLLIVISMVLAACTPKAATEVAVEEETTAGETTTKEPVVLKFLKIADELEAQALAEIVAEFQTIEDGKYSHVSIEVDAKPFAELFPAIEKAVATGSGIDIVQADGPDVKHFAYNDVLMDVTDYFTEEEMAQWAPQSIAEGSMNGRFYGPPEVQSCQLMWFNKDMLDAAGIDYTDTAGWTYGVDGPIGRSSPLMPMVMVPPKSSVSKPLDHGITTGTFLPAPMARLDHPPMLVSLMMVLLSLVTSTLQKLLRLTHSSRIWSMSTKSCLLNVSKISSSQGWLQPISRRT